MSDVLLRCTVCRALLDEEDLFCPNCGTESPLPREAAEPTSFISTHNFQCASCGASMSYDASAQKLRCPFCGSERLEERQDTKTWAPNRVVPFVVGQEQAVLQLRRWLKQGFWRPGDLSDAAIITKMAPVFVPYWVFAARTYSFWTADSSQTPFGARGKWFPLTGDHHGEFAGLLIGASAALTPAETLALCPFQLSQAVSRDEVDLTNIVFEQFRVQRKYARPLAQQGFEQLIQQECLRQVPGTARNLKINVRLEGLTSEAVFLPVWIAAYRYRDQVYRFLLNGQTGQATGLAPTSMRKVVLVVGAVAITVVLVVATIALCSGVMGR